MRQLCKVMPLVDGLRGFNAQEVETALSLGAPGWLDIPDAIAAEERGDVVRMAGNSPQAVQEALRTRMMRSDLQAREPAPSATPEQHKREYRTRAVKAE